MPPNRTPPEFSGHASRQARFERDNRSPGELSRLYERLSDLLASNSVVTSGELETRLKQSGIEIGQPRFADLAPLFADTDTILSADLLASHLNPDAYSLLESALNGTLVIRDFSRFRNRISDLFQYSREFTRGEVANYIPELARSDPEAFALSMCSIDGQQFDLGQSNTAFSLQSAMKPLNYALAVELYGDSYVHRYVGREPSGRRFNELALNVDNLPHNPMINAGAIMCSALLHPSRTPEDRFKLVRRFWGSAMGMKQCGFDQSVYESELHSAERNYALADLMVRKNAFPHGVSIDESLALYFKSCAITMDSNHLAVVAATLANGGVCPLTGHRVIAGKTVKNTLSLMLSCGMYDYSGEYAFSVGLPAKSGVSGALMIVVPGVCGFALWSPPLDRLGNSVRGVEFSKQLVESFPFHVFASVAAS